MISISTTVFDMIGNLIIKNETPSFDMRTLSRRINRSKTLDGGVVLQDSGFAHGDRTFNIKVVAAKKDYAERMFYLTSNYAELLFVNSEGVFEGNIENYSFLKGNLNFTFLVIQKLT